MVGFFPWSLIAWVYQALLKFGHAHFLTYLSISLSTVVVDLVVY